MPLMDFFRSNKGEQVPRSPAVTQEQEARQRYTSRSIDPQQKEVLLTGHLFNLAMEALISLGHKGLVGWNYTNERQKQIAVHATTGRLMVDMLENLQTYVYLYQGQLGADAVLCSAGASGSEIKSIFITNTTAGTIAVTLNAANGAASVANTIFNDIVPANTTVIVGSDKLALPLAHTYDIRGTAAAVGVGVTIVGRNL